MVRTYTQIGNRSLTKTLEKTKWGLSISEEIAKKELALGAEIYVAAKAKGPDTWGEDAALRVNKSIEIVTHAPTAFPNFWDRLKSFRQRNVEVAKTTDIAYALMDCNYIAKKPWGGGTGHTLAVMKDLGKPTEIFCSCGACTLQPYRWKLYY